MKIIATYSGLSNDYSLRGVCIKENTSFRANKAILGQHTSFIKGVCSLYKLITHYSTTKFYTLSNENTKSLLIFSTQLTPYRSE